MGHLHNPHLVFVSFHRFSEGLMLQVRLSGVALTALVSLSSAHATVVESFDSGTWGADWSKTSEAGTISTAAAHDGAYGVELNGSTWTYNPSVHFEPGQTLSAWFRPTDSHSSGRFYLGFGSDPFGSDSFVAAVNTRELMFQDNTVYDYAQLNGALQTWTPDWYRLSVTWHTDGTAVGKLFAADGVTLLNSVTQSGLTRTGRGIALRGFDGFHVDTLSVSTVPEASTPIMMLIGLAGLGATVAIRRRNGL
jgi:hypothetical protein